MLTSVFYKKNIHVTDLHPSNSFVVSIDLYWSGGFFNALPGQILHISTSLNRAF